MRNFAVSHIRVMKVGNVYISAGYANYWRKRYRLKKGEDNGRRRNGRNNENKEKRYVTTDDNVV